MALDVVEGAGWLVGEVAVRSARFAIQMRRARPGPPAQDVALHAEDGVAVAGTYWPGARSDSPAVLLVHGLAATRQVIAPNAAWFAAQGYAVLTIDLRGHGESGPDLHSFGWYESRDVHAAFAWLKARQHGAKVAVIGISMGGAALLLGERGPVAADAIVLQAVFADIHRTIHSRIAFFAGAKAAERFEPVLSSQSLRRYGIDPGRLAPIAVLPELTCPVFVIGGEKDRFTPPQETQAIYEAAREPKVLWIAPGLGHGGLSDTLSEDYRGRVLAFLQGAIGPADVSV